MMRNWANRFGPSGIRVNTIHPTGVNSPMVNNDAFTRYVEENPDIAKDLQNILPVPLIECVDISNAILFLCSDKGRYVTGHTMVVDAGFTAR
jgi:NAD(P)-dependent dehydrogenase (short-subunit alcohol dehydrogenase family)